MRDEDEWLPIDERIVRRRAHNRGFQVIRIGGHEGRRRSIFNIGAYMLIDHERVHLFAATRQEILDYLADKPEIDGPLHDDKRKRSAALERLKEQEQRKRLAFLDVWKED